MNHSEMRKFLIISFFNSPDLDFQSKRFGSGSVDSHIFSNPDQVSQNVADSTDPDPKH